MIRSFGPAFKGIVESIKEGNNLKVQLVAAWAALLFSYFLGISLMEYAMILICIALVLSAELFNTCIELIVDKITQEQEEWARKTKDAAAGAVLILAILSVIIAVIIWMPYILMKWF